MFDPIVAKAGSYEAWTNGVDLRIRKDNGVVVGEGQVGMGAGGFWIGGYEGKLDDEVRKAVEALLAEHFDDLVALRLALAGGGATA